MCDVRGGCCGSWSTSQILGGLNALEKFSPKYRSEPVAASLPAWHSDRYPHLYLTPFKATIPSNLFFLFFGEASHGFNYLRTFCTFHLLFRLGDLLLSCGEGVSVR